MNIEFTNKEKKLAEEIFDNVKKPAQKYHIENCLNLKYTEHFSDMQPRHQTNFCFISRFILNNFERKS